MATRADGAAVKVCTKCGEEKELGEFYNNKGKKDGKQSQCKKCYRKYREENKEVLSKRRKKYREKNKEALAKYFKKYAQENPHKCACRQMVKGAIALGLLVRQPCELCCGEPTEAHHDSYLPEHALVVRWLCKSCHGRYHAREGKMRTHAEEKAQEVTTSALTMARAEIEALDGWTIDTAEESDMAAVHVQTAITRKKALEKTRKTITVPMNAALKATNDLFRPPREALEKIEGLLKSKIADYIEAIEKKNDAALSTVASAETAEGATAALATVAVVDAPAGVTVRHKWRAEVFRADIVPDEFHTPDLDKIQAYTNGAVKMHGAPTPIPGVRFEKIPIVTSRQVK